MSFVHGSRKNTYAQPTGSVVFAYAQRAEILVCFVLSVSYQEIRQLFHLPAFHVVCGCDTVNKIQKLSSFKSDENIHKREDGSYYVVSANKASSVTL